MNIQLSKRDIKALCQFASRDEWRGELPKIAVWHHTDGKSVSLGATDGHTACHMVIGIGRGEDAPPDRNPDALFSGKALTGLAKGLGAKDVITLQYLPDAPEGREFRALGANGATVEGEDGATSYPPLAKVWGNSSLDSAPAQVFGINPAYLARLAVIQDALSAGPLHKPCKAPVLVRVRHGEALDPVYFGMDNDREDGTSASWRVIIMPVWI